MSAPQTPVRKEFDKVVYLLDEALAPNAPTITATSIPHHVALGLGMGLKSRLLAVGTLVDDPPASAGALDCLRSMAEACAHLSWLVEGSSGTLEQRALCLQLGQANADLENRRAVAKVMSKAWIPQEPRTNVNDGLTRAETVAKRIREQHGSNCPACGCSGRGSSAVQGWLKSRALRATALKRDVDLYSLWKGASADAHQVQPQRWNQPDDGRHVLALPAELRHLLGQWALQCFLEGWWFVATVIRPDALSIITGVDTKVGGLLQAWRSRPRKATPDETSP